MSEHVYDGNGYCQIHGGWCSMAASEPAEPAYDCADECRNCGAHISEPHDPQCPHEWAVGHTAT